MQHITVFFKNSLQLEGKLISLNDNQMILRSLDEINEIVIPDITDTVLYYKINSSEDRFSELKNKKNRRGDDISELVRLKGELNRIELSSIKEKINSPIIPSLVKESKYEPQLNTTEQIINQHSNQKIKRTNRNFAIQMQKLFTKKY